MDMSRRLINLIGTAGVLAIVLGGSVLIVLPLFTGAQAATAQAAAGAESNRFTRAELDELARQEAVLNQLRVRRFDLREQITEDEELRDASALASAAARLSGARIVAITFGERQAFAPPTGAGIGDDGRPTVPEATGEPDDQQGQVPVTFEAEVSSPSQAATFIDGLRAGPRLVQVVQAEASPTNNDERFTVTVDALIFAARS